MPCHYFYIIRKILKDKAMTLVVNNQTFRVEKTEDVNFPYYLHGKRKSCYALIRNVQGLLVPFSITKSCIGGVYTDVNGVIELAF